MKQKNEGKSTLLRMSKAKFCGKIGSLTVFPICWFLKFLKCPYLILRLT